MQKYQIKFENPFYALFLTLLLGVLVGLVTAGFLAALNWIAGFHAQQNVAFPWHLFLIPLVLGLSEWVRRHTLYFPIKVSELRSPARPEQWSKKMSGLHFLGTLLSHVSGASVGREGASVLYSAGFVRALGLQWFFWGPIVSSMGFAAVLGQYWVAPIFMFEFFQRTSVLQKVLGLIGSTVAVLLIQSLGLPHLFSGIPVDSFVGGFWDKLLLLMILGISSGYLMRAYKAIHYRLIYFFEERQFFWRLLFSLLLVGILFIPEFRKFQSLGLDQLNNLEHLQAMWLDAPVKLSLTVLSVSLGLWGGEFIPLVYAGVHWGQSLFVSWGQSATLGALVGAYLLFAAATRMRWTSYALLLLTVGFSWWFWGWILITFTLWFAGSRSLYRSH
ncbi:chloride channel protein [Pseudobdellovibrio exovorus]|uniref:Chloride channel protein n=1 Tax=Pseudobdellovibrio exovorus JSS TaxID=1184267 RepID=M4VA01_9BACT|nr:chloride channel protein [Pseudobdellovibrio exovorus]AGH94856.1 hypothetical protein A11Q_636 [Pseudobdellovibrio exovorus JSS]